MKRYYGSINKRGSYYHWRFRNVDGSFTSRVVKNDADGKVTYFAEAEKIVISWSSEISSLQQLKTNEEPLLKIAEVKTLLKVCRVPLAELEETFFNHPSAPSLSPKRKHDSANMTDNYTTNIKLLLHCDLTSAQYLLYYIGGMSTKNVRPGHFFCFTMPSFASFSLANEGFMFL